MLRNVNRYVVTSINITQFLTDFDNRFKVVSQRSYKGKPQKGLGHGVTMTLQVLEDHAPPILNKDTGEPIENNVLENFNVTFIGDLPVVLKKGDIITIDSKGFLPEVSYYIDFNLILRFRADAIKVVKTEEK